MVEGLTKLAERWGSIPARVKAHVAAAMEKVAEEVVRDMRRLAPKGDTGELVRSINWTWGDAPAGTITIAKATGGQDYGALTITIYAGGGKAFYARFQEHGTKEMPANPFFFPVWRVWKRRFRARISAAVRRAIKAG